MSRQRERKIIEGLLVTCIAAAVTCFALILLPNQLRRAGAVPPERSPFAGPANLSSIISLNAARPAAAAAPAARGTIARFVPEGEPQDPSVAAAQARATEAIKDDLGAAGGAGVAIDGDSAESTVALDRRYDDRAGKGAGQPATPPASDPPSDLAAAPAADLGAPPAGSELSKLQVLPPASLALRAKGEASGRERPKPSPAWLATPPGLEADVAFWRDVYAKYDKNQVVLHHPRYLGIVYDVVDLSDIESDPRLNDVERARQREQRVDERRQAITDILRKLSTSPPATSLSDEEWRIQKLFAHVSEGDAFRRAADDDGVRAQLGQRDKFITGLAYSGRYLGEIEAIFESYGLPKELTRIVFVESMFNPHARSSVGASGIWQFMRGTGKLYVRVNDLLDERNDPIAATHAAAKLLRQNYETLGSWPLAINAYNAGRGRLQQAAAQMGSTDIGRIIRGFSHPAYGFASRNFFLEFLAAYDVAEHAEHSFGPIAYDPPVRFEVVRSPYHLSLPSVARVAGIPIEALTELNPAFNDCLLEGRKLLPAGMEIRVPERTGALFLAAAARAPRSSTGALHHVVQDGDTLVSIAQTYGVTATAIVKANQGINRNVSRGQTLVIPNAGGQ